MTGQGRAMEKGREGWVLWALPYVGQAVIELCIEQVLSGQLLAPVSGWSGPLLQETGLSERRDGDVEKDTERI